MDEKLSVLPSVPYVHAISNPPLYVHATIFSAEVKADDLALDFADASPT